jgi:cysteine desulfurase / selenocysteine lyase
MSNSASTMPPLDDMLQSLLLIEEGEHEFTPEEENVRELRQLFFPVTRNCVYLNHAADGPLPRPTARTMHTYIDDLSRFGSVNFGRWGMYEQGAHRRLANMLNVRPDQIAMTASTDDSLMHIADGLNWREGDAIVTAECEFPSNVYFWLNLQQRGVHVHFVKTHENRIRVADVLAQITERTKLVSLSMVEFSTGFRNDIAVIARHCHERGILCGIDAMQAMGALDIDAQLLGVDFLASAGHKWLLSPPTTGILYLSDNLLAQLRMERRGWFSVETPFEFFKYDQQLKQGAARFEHGSTNRVAIVALDASLGVFESIDGGMQAVEARILGLTSHAIAGLERLGYPVVSPQGAGERSGIVCFQPHPDRQNLTPQHIVDELAARQIYAAARATVVRISPHFYNTIEEIDTLLNTLEAIKQ